MSTKRDPKNLAKLSSNLTVVHRSLGPVQEFVGMSAVIFFQEGKSPNRINIPIRLHKQSNNNHYELLMTIMQ